MRPKSIFLFFLDHEIHVLFGLEKAYGKQRVYDELSMATKIAFILSEDNILVPASNFFESDFSFSLLNTLGADKTNEAGYLKLLTSSYSLDELLQKKKDEHGESITNTGYHYVDFLYPQKEIYLPGTLLKRDKSASLDIRSAWLSDDGITKLGKTIYEAFPGEYSPTELERIIESIPQGLGKRAYISKYIIPFFNTPQNGEVRLDNIINSFITTEYIRSFLDEYGAVCLNDIPILKSADKLLPQGHNYQHISYQKYASILNRIKYKGKSAFDHVKQSSLDGLLEFKNSNSWKRIFENSSDPTSSTLIVSGASVGRLGNSMKNRNVTLGIVTALPKEYAAVKKMLSGTKEVFNKERGNGERYLVGTIRSADNNTHHIALMQCGEGNNRAAVRCTEMLKYFPSIKAVVMCGIAGGVPNPEKASDHVRLGDIVVSTHVYQYDYGKKKGDAWEAKTVPIGSSALFQRTIAKIQADEYEDVIEWQKYIDSFGVGKFEKPNMDTDRLFSANGTEIKHPEDRTRTHYPKVHYGCIASGNIVLKDPKMRNNLRDNYGVKAAEMEGSGIIDAASDEKVDFIIVRGICDYCDIHKNDLWQEYAALVAAAYTRSLLENIPCLSEDTLE